MDATMAKAIIIGLLAVLLSACAASGPTISGSGGDYWKNYGNGHGADANGS